MKRILVAFGLMIAAVSGARAESVLRTMIATDIRGLMPGNSPDDNTGTVLQNIYEGLVAWRADGTVAPMLTKDIETSADGKTYTFTLRDGVRFHNGAPLSSREVV
jgi:peptide/nickel transport system substrate-binding protein